MSASTLKVGIMKNSSPRPFSVRAASFGLAGVLGASLLATLVPAQVVTAAAPAGEYIVTFDSASNLSAKLRKEMQLGNAITDIFTSAADGFVATLDSSDVARLRNDSDVASIELNKVIRLVDDTPVTSASAVAVTLVQGPPEVTLPEPAGPLNVAPEKKVVVLPDIT